MNNTNLGKQYHAVAKVPEVTGLQYRTSRPKNMGRIHQIISDGVMI
mgnify:CR=1 FL=1